jgi:GT2 family glycosyltransferase
MQKIGNISQEFSKQHGGDIDYGLRAKYAGFESWVAPGVIGTCSSNSIDGTIFDTSLSLKERIKKMNTPQGVPPAKEWMIFTKRHAGFLWPYYWLRTIIRVMFPWTYLLFRKPQ